MLRGGVSCFPWSFATCLLDSDFDRVEDRVRNVDYTVLSPCLKAKYSCFFNYVLMMHL